MRSRQTRRAGMDLFLMLFLSMGAVLYLILPLINIPREENAPAPPPQGNVIVEIYWDDALRSDIDLWVLAPGGVPVGYSNKGGIFFNLLRDDLGHFSDPSERNMEIAYSRGIPSGEYVVNAHLFNLKQEPLPITVRLVVSVKVTDDAPYEPIFTLTADLTRNNEELTLARFRMEDGEMVPGSFHRIRKPIRSKGGP